jgi:hypothetical protein
MLSLTACTSRTAAIEKMVEELNSPAFRAKEAQTGLFDDSKAEIKDNQLVLTFLCRAVVDLSSINEADMPALQSMTVDEFKGNLVDSKFREGIEALNKADMTILLVWQDVNGNKINITVNPADILNDKK